MKLINQKHLFVLQIYSPSTSAASKHWKYIVPHLQPPAKIEDAPQLLDLFPLLPEPPPFEVAFFVGNELRVDAKTLMPSSSIILLLAMMLESLCISYSHFDCF